MNAINNLFNQPRFGVILLRWTLAILMIFHGWAKVTGGVGGIEGMLVGKGLPGFIAYGVYLGELIAPLLLLVGVWVVPAALVIAINMVFALVLVHSSHFMDITNTGGWRPELQAFFLMTALVVAFTNKLGPNKG
ncbi:MAG: DoxX family protein [Hydrogenophaga sp.]|nr:DoxX family protein [Hydrogenophaga sp.]MDP1783669.1 DoxX family protein [Hydrogenophaga sp.]